MELKMREQTTYRKEVLELVRVRAQARLLTVFAEPATVRFTADALCDALVMNVTQPIWVQPGDTWKCSYPADWWQALKARWLPQWLLRRYPVEKKTEGIAVRVLYPRQAFPKDQSYAQVACWDGDDWNWNGGPKRR